MEKQSEYELRCILNKENFNKNCLFNSITENEILKNLFKNASKNNSGNCGFPDYIYFDNKTLIIMECKSHNLVNAVKDYLHYFSFVKNNVNYNIFGIAFVNSTNYKIFNRENLLINKIISKNIFNIKIEDELMSIEQMNSIIHDIHNYIRTNTNIKNDDKPFFIASILIFLKNENNKLLVENFNEKLYLYDLIQNSLKNYNIDYTIFEFMRNDNNNIKLLTLIKKVKKIYNQNSTQDLLNLFYHEFVKYQNTDSKSLGIVLTPDHIANLMILFGNIKKDDIFLDLCSGTGTFALKSSNITKNLICCEWDLKLFTLLKCNFILRNLPLENLYNNDCFEKNFKADISIINPPYGNKKNKNELDFILKQLDSVKENGQVIAIIPISCFSHYLNKKNLILKQAKIKNIIICNKKIFEPVAKIQVLIIHLEKNKEGHIYDKDYVKFYDYQDDGIESVKHNGRIKTNFFDEKFNKMLNNFDEILLKETDEWWFFYTIIKNQKINYINIYKDLIKEKIYLEYINKINLIEKNNIKIQLPLNTKIFKITDLFDIFNGKRRTSTFVKNNIGIYPYISSGKINNGISGYINEYNFETNDNEYFISLAIQGSVGSAFPINGKFWVTDGVVILKPKIKLSLDILKFICNILKEIGKNFSFERSLKQERLEKEDIILPILENNIIDEKYIINFNNLLLN